MTDQKYKLGESYTFDVGIAASNVIEARVTSYDEESGNYALSWSDTQGYYHDEWSESELDRMLADRV